MRPQRVDGCSRRGKTRRRDVQQGVEGKSMPDYGVVSDIAGGFTGVGFQQVGYRLLDTVSSYAHKSSFKGANIAF